MMLTAGLINGIVKHYQDAKVFMLAAIVWSLIYIAECTLDRK